MNSFTERKLPSIAGLCWPHTSHEPGERYPRRLMEIRRLILGKLSRRIKAETGWLRTTIPAPKSESEKNDNIPNH